MFILYLEKLVLLNKKFSKYENNNKEKNESTCSNMSLFYVAYVQSKCVSTNFYSYLKYYLPLQRNCC